MIGNAVSDGAADGAVRIIIDVVVEADSVDDDTCENVHMQRRLENYT